MGHGIVVGVEGEVGLRKIEMRLHVVGRYSETLVAVRYYIVPLAGPESGYGAVRVEGWVRWVEDETGLQKSNLSAPVPLDLVMLDKKIK